MSVFTETFTELFLQEKSGTVHYALLNLHVLLNIYNLSTLILNERTIKETFHLRELYTN